jgi:enolase
MSNIQRLEPIELVGSRGNPTIAVTVTLSSGVKATTKIPSGASTGERASSVTLEEERGMREVLIISGGEDPGNSSNHGGKETQQSAKA